MLESGLTSSLVTTLLQRSLLTVLEFWWRKLRTLQTRPWTGVCETLMPDVVAHQAHLNNHSYVRELSGPAFDSLHNNLALWVVTRRTSKKPTLKLSKLGGGCLPGTIHMFVRILDCYLCYL